MEITKDTIKHVATLSRLAFNEEVYANDQAYDNHVQTPHYEEYIEETDGMVERRDVKTLVRDVLATQGAIVLDY